MGSGEAWSKIENNINKTHEEIHIGSDGDAFIYTNLQNGFASRKQFSFFKNGNFSASGTISANTFNASNPPWSDFVFEEDYELLSICEVERFIKSNKHLPDVPSEDDVKKDGVDLVKMNAVLLQKIEELSLYIIDQEKRIQKLEKND